MPKLKTNTEDFLLEKIEIDPDYSNREGYNKNFLKTKISLPELNQEQKKSAVKVKGNSNELKYHHFSIVLNKARKLPFFSAVNFDGISYNKIKKSIPKRKDIGTDKWFFDTRIDKNIQVPASFYAGNDFDLGHLVRREDTVWGKNKAEAIKANNDSFHLTNATPQHKDFNRNKNKWLGLEDYALQNARKNILKITVFAGPVFNKLDKKLKNVQIPRQFWKIITMIKKDGKLSSTGYIVSQEDLVKDMKLEEFVYGQYQTYQVPISKLETLTGLKFNLSKYDPLQKGKKRIDIEALTFEAPKPINKLENIVF
jgi:endonuclease G, mitochondrial